MRSEAFGAKSSSPMMTGSLASEVSAGEAAELDAVAGPLLDGWIVKAPEVLLEVAILVPVVIAVVVVRRLVAITTDGSGKTPPT